ncbi:S49 family peptidase [Roseinatronobacter bogoriensis]|uniref:Serine peptidase n=1 Tax=Roseinatronobacter bogoriensis subsp. barguzinensis TaxID=441209 RepID=A0A2K8KFG2_9RHOB|nr:MULTISPECIES: S49 family peptidase [Rhodobaca]ATX65528.1 serine peptidase [Rhodobaca barguzinensis]MBB4209812.1 ClpP class serine protease [Rhodobaca bogoriensis DSM 18756]TDW33230.1 peptidase S49-like protein [Rhodobaca barguzinensis]TDY66081.1 protein C [Rhodobaca bogoriensis DSM 18756]
MLHARIAARAFNTPLLVEPSKAMAFLSGLGPRILGRRVELANDVEAPVGAATLPARASLLVGGLADSYRQHGDAPYPVVDGIAVIEIAGVLIHRGGWIGQSSGQTSYEGIAAQIEAAASDPAVRGLALEIDSFGGEVAGAFDLADRIRAIRGAKPVWAFVAEHAFSAGYALASQADRILLPRTGALGSIGVVVLHADLSGQLDQDGVRVTLIHSGLHKVDGNPYQPLPEGVRGDIQREIDVLRFLFAETVAAGRSGKISHEAALATEAATYRGADALAAGLADEVTDLTRGFAAFRQMLSRTPTLSPMRTTRASLPHPRQEALMATQNDPDDSPQDTGIDVTDIGDGETDAPDDQPDVAQTPAETQLPAAAVAAPAPTAPQAGNLAELSAQLREAAAEIAEIAAQAGRLGIAIDAAKALREGTTPEALRRLVLERASAAADARDIVAAPRSPVLPIAKESPIVAAAKRAAASGHRV